MGILENLNTAQKFNTDNDLTENCNSIQKLGRTGQNEEVTNAGKEDSRSLQMPERRGG